MFSKTRSMKAAACFLSFAALVFSPWLLAPAHTQVAGATLSGTVTDKSGGVVPQAAISIKNIATGIRRTTTKEISENFNAQFQAEFFNVLNHANFAVPPIALNHTDIFGGTGAALGTAGVLNATSTQGREIQFALKFAW